MYPTDHEPFQSRVPMRAALPLAVCLAAMTVCQGVVPAAQKAALQDIYNDMNGPNWELWATPWDFRTDPCTAGWQGITCDASNSTVM